MNSNNIQHSTTEPIPNSTLILVLGILSILTSFMYGIVGLICGIIALVLSKNARKTYHDFKEKYTRDSYNQLEIGRICAIIGIIFSSLFIICAIFIALLFLDFLGYLVEIFKIQQ